MSEVKKKGWQKRRRRNKKGVKRGKEKRRKRTKRRLSEQDVRVLFLWKLLISSVKGEIWRVVVVFLGGEKPDDLFDFEPHTRVEVPMVPTVTDVLVSHSSVVTERCEVSSCCSDWEFVEPQSCSFSKKAGLDSYAGRDEVRRFTSESAPPSRKA